MVVINRNEAAHKDTITAPEKKKQQAAEHSWESSYRPLTSHTFV